MAAKTMIAVDLTCRPAGRAGRSVLLKAKTKTA
jgi:hypothetical protein